MPGAEEVVVRETALERVGVGRLVGFVCVWGRGKGEKWGEEERGGVMDGVREQAKGKEKFCVLTKGREVWKS